MSLLSLYVSVSLFVCISVCLFVVVNLMVWLSVYMFLCPFVCLIICQVVLIICQVVCLCLSLYVIDCCLYILWLLIDQFICLCLYISLFVLLDCQPCRSFEDWLSGCWRLDPALLRLGMSRGGFLRSSDLRPYEVHNSLWGRNDRLKELFTGIRLKQREVYRPFVPLPSSPSQTYDLLQTRHAPRTTIQTYGYT